MVDDDGTLEHLSVSDILTVHELIVESSEDTPSGVSSPGDVEYIVEHVRDGHFGRGPVTIHETAYQLLRLLVANHPFVDGNKRTALAAVVTFYARNGRELRYDRELKEILKSLATDERNVDEATVLAYLSEHTNELPEEYRTTYRMWTDLIDRGDESGDQNGYSDADPTR